MLVVSVQYFVYVALKYSSSDAVKSTKSKISLNQIALRVSIHVKKINMVWIYPHFQASMVRLGII